MQPCTIRLEPVAPPSRPVAGLARPRPVPWPVAFAPGSRPAGHWSRTLPLIFNGITEITRHILLIPA